MASTVRPCREAKSPFRCMSFAPALLIHLNYVLGRSPSDIRSQSAPVHLSNIRLQFHQTTRASRGLSDTIWTGDTLGRWFAQQLPLISCAHCFFALNAGDDHRRHRKVMLPGFSGPDAKAFVPIFSGCASKVRWICVDLMLDILPMIAKLGAKWRDIITSSTDPSVVLDIPSWASRATLDAIGEGQLIF